MQEGREMKEQVGNTLGSFTGHMTRDGGNGEIRVSFWPIEPEVPRGHPERTAETCKQMAMGLASSLQRVEEATHGEHKPIA